MLDNSGLNSNKELPNLLRGNLDGCEEWVDVFGGEIGKGVGVLDSYACKLNAILLASKAALTVLRVD